MPAQTTIPAETVLVELREGDDFQELGDTAQLKSLDRACDEICTAYIARGSGEYDRSNMASPLPALSISQNERHGFGTASIDGTFVPFSSPVATPYTLKVWGYKDGQEFVVSFFNPLPPNADTRVTTGFTAFAAEDDVIVEYDVARPL